MIDKKIEMHDCIDRKKKKRAKRQKREQSEREKRDRKKHQSGAKPDENSLKKQKKSKSNVKIKRYRKEHSAGKSRFAQSVLIVLVAAVMYLVIRPGVVDEITIEAGANFPALSEFLTHGYVEADFSEPWEDELNLNTVADYEIGITISGKEYTSLLHVTDTIAPVVEAKEAQTFKDEVLEPDDFIETVEDVTATMAEFVETPDFSAAGKQAVSLYVTDEGGNTVKVCTVMDVLEDTEPPVIEGVKELSVAVGGSISYKKNVTVTDDYDENVQLTIDSSEVDLNKVGDYNVTYIAEDAAGNVTEESTKVHVKPAGVETATEEIVNAKADEVLAQITTPEMSQYDKAKAIFNWVNSHVGWSDGTPKTNWVQGAYRGLFYQKGDCFVYASTSKCLLTRAGINNMDIGFSNPRRTHYWNLIDLGEGWYHFDCTRRVDGKTFFYCSDEEIMAYSNTHNGSHAYDPSAYPTIQ